MLARLKYIGKNLSFCLICEPSISASVCNISERARAKIVGWKMGEKKENKYKLVSFSFFFVGSNYSIEEQTAKTQKGTTWTIICPETVQKHFSAIADSTCLGQESSGKHRAAVAMAGPLVARQGTCERGGIYLSVVCGVTFSSTPYSEVQCSYRCSNDVPISLISHQSTTGNGGNSIHNQQQHRDLQVFASHKKREKRIFRAARQSAYQRSRKCLCV